MGWHSLLSPPIAYIYPITKSTNTRITNTLKHMKIEGSFFVDPRIQKEVVEDLENYGFESIEIKDSSFQPMITFWGEEEEIDSWFEENKWEISE